MATDSISSALRRRLYGVAGLVSIGMATPALAASAWDLPPPPRNLAATASLLGGESAVLRTWAAQGIVAEAAPAFAPAMTTGSAVASSSPPASWSRTLDRSEKPGNSGLIAPVEPRPNASSTGGPDVFGSVALPIGNTPYDSMWRRASAPRAGALAGWTATFAPVRGDTIRLLREVNGWVNQRVDFIEDNVDGVPAEIWQNAAESLRRGRGDCEDYALAKLALLAAMGFDRDDLFLVIARDLVARSHHAVLAVRTGGRFVILDNATDELIEGDRANDYRPIFSYSSAGRWIHGYSGSPSHPPIQIAAAASAISAP